MFSRNLLFFVSFVTLNTYIFSCSAEDDRENNNGASDSDNDVDTDTDTDADTDTDTDGEFSWSDSAIVADCSNCSGVGKTLDDLLCSIDLCFDEDVVIDHDNISPTGAISLDAFEGVERFGDDTNDLEPLLGGSYALMATGATQPDIHSGALGGNSTKDPFSKNKNRFIYDVMEWRLHLRAPIGVRGFRVHYVFFSVEYDEFVGSQYNDKFYIFIEAPSTNDGERTVVNFTECRNPDNYSDFTCEAGMSTCDEGDKYCYIAINTALSECCWKNGCPDKTEDNTDISGTGFECGTKKQDDISLTGNGGLYGSSTGWLRTEWPVEPGEEFDVIFHIHDTSDTNLDSEVIIDKFEFIGNADPGTAPV